jgi:ABC-2 type transport system permease protein
VYPPTLLEEQAPEWLYNVLRLNPINGFVEVYRRCLYDAAAPGWRTMLALVAVSFGSLAIGWVIFHRFARRLPEEV